MSHTDTKCKNTIKSRSHSYQTNIAVINNWTMLTSFETHHKAHVPNRMTDLAFSVTGQKGKDGTGEGVKPWSCKWDGGNMPINWREGGNSNICMERIEGPRWMGCLDYIFLMSIQNITLSFMQMWSESIYNECGKVWCADLRQGEGHDEYMHYGRDNTKF